MPDRVETQFHGRTLTIETGKIARLAGGAVTVQYGDTMILGTANRSEPRPGLDFFPLTVDFEERMAAAATLDDEEQVGDLVAAAGILHAEPVGLIGFCMGGMYAIKAAATDRFDRVAPFYGMIRVPANWAGEGQGQPLELLAASPGSAARVHAIIGTADPYTPPEDVDALEAAGATVVRYEGAEHGFVHDPSRPAHRADDAADAWSRVIDWLRS